MRRLLALGLLVGLSRAAGGQTDAPPARLVVEGGPRHLVGQVVNLDVLARAGGTRPIVTAPPVEGGLLGAVGVALRPIAASGIGAVEAQINEYHFRYRFVALRAGTIVIAPFRLEFDGKTSATGPLRLEIRPVPAVGRPASWLGGVGRSVVRLEAVPADVRVGQSFEAVVSLDGPGALGSTAPLDRTRLESLAIAPVVTTLEDQVSLEPPRRVRRWRVRPTRPGQVKLPPVVVAWFDPDSGRYQTAASGAVGVRVVAPPRLDPARIELPATDRRFSRIGLALGGAAVLLLLGWGLTRIGRRPWRRARPRDPREAARRLADRLASQAARGDPVEVARCVLTALSDYVEAARGGPVGTLTPHEAHAALESVGLGPRAAALVERCDRVVYSGRPATNGEDLAREGLSLLESLADRAGGA